MFEDDSSSEEEELKTTEKTTATPKDDDKTTEESSDEKKKSSSNDDDDDDDDDDNDKKAGDSEEKKKPKLSAGLFDDSSDDDDDDNVFDDAGAVVGSSAPPSAKKSDTDLDGGDATTKKKSSERINRTQNVTVLQADRPEEGTSLHMTKLPNVVAIQPTAFDEADYDENEEEEQYKGYMHNMVRWRYKRDENGGLVRDGSGGEDGSSSVVVWSERAIPNWSSGATGHLRYTLAKRSLTFKTWIPPTAMDLPV